MNGACHHLTTEQAAATNGVAFKDQRTTFTHGVLLPFPKARAALHCSAVAAF